MNLLVQTLGNQPSKIFVFTSVFMDLTARKTPKNHWSNTSKNYVGHPIWNITRVGIINMISNQFYCRRKKLHPWYLLDSFKDGFTVPSKMVRHRKKWKWIKKRVTITEGESCTVSEVIKEKESGLGTIHDIWKISLNICPICTSTKLQSGCK